MKHAGMSQKLPLGLALALTAVLFCGPAAAQAPAAAGVPVRITVTAVSREKGQQPPPLSKADFLVYQNHERRPVLDAVRQTGEADKLDLYIVMDEAVTSEVALQYRDIADFIHELPSTARVGVAYALNGTVTVAQDLTDNRQAAVKALRIPFGRIGAGGGIYLSLQDVAKRLPPVPDRRRAILFLSSGIDLFRGYQDSYAGLNPDLDVAINHLDRNGITAYAIYVSPASHFEHSLFLTTNGQSCLAYLTDQTGGEAYFQGLGTPISMKPFLNEMLEHLNNQYVVTFDAKPAKHSDYAGLHVTTELSGVEVTGPSRVYVPVEK